MNQKFSVTLFASGLTGFLGMATEMLAGHNEWSYLYSTPLGFIHGLVLGVTFIAMVIGALGIQLPRSNQQERSTDAPLTPDGTVTVTTTTKTDSPIQEPKP